MNEIHLQRPDFAYSACEQFTKNKERIRKYSRFKINFQHNMAFRDFKDLPTRTVSDKALR